MKLISNMAVMLFAIAAVSGGCAAVGGVALGVVGPVLPLRTEAPVPADIAVSAPSSDAPANIAGFSGAWAGKTERGTFPPRRHILVVEKITTAGAEVVFVLDGIPNALNLDVNKFRSERANAQLRDGELNVRVGEWQASYSLKDGELVASLRHPGPWWGTFVFRATLRRVDATELQKKKEVMLK